MEYTLLLDKKQKYLTLISLMVFYLIFIVYTWFFMGIYGYLMSIGLLFFSILTPLLLGKYKLFLFIWIFIVPFSELLGIFILKGAFNPLTYFFTGLSFPLAIYLMFIHFGKIIKELPYTKYIFLITFLIILNLLRQDHNFFAIFRHFRLHFIELFIIICTWFFLKKYSHEILFKWINVFAFLNALVTLFQGVTGVGNLVVEGVERSSGLFGHPGSLGLFINIFLPLGLYLYIKTEDKRAKNFYLANILLNLVALILTFTKAAYIVAFINFLVFAVFSPSKYKNKLFFAFLGGLVLMFIVNFFTPQNFINNIIQRFHNTDSLNWRLMVWDILLSKMDFISILLGHGEGSAPKVLSQSVIGGFASSHNLYIDYLFEYGILGILYMFNFIALAFIFFKKLIMKNMEDNFSYIVPFGVLASILLDSFSTNASNDARLVLFTAWIIVTIFYTKMKLQKETNYCQES